VIDVPHWFLPKDPPKTRVCRTCYEEKPVELFRNTRKDKTQCLECKRKDDAEYRKNHPKMKLIKSNWHPMIRHAERD